MGKRLTGYSGEPRENPPAKMFYGACIGAYEIGHQKAYKSGDPPNLQFLLEFELWSRKKSGPQPALDSKGVQFTISMFVGASLGSPTGTQKANLLIACEALEAREYAAEDFVKGVDLEMLLGRLCKVDIRHTETGKAKIDSILAMDEDDDTFTPNGPFRYWEMPGRWDGTIPEATEISELARNRLKLSAEFRSIFGEPSGDDGTGGGQQAPHGATAAPPGQNGPGRAAASGGPPGRPTPARPAAPAGTVDPNRPDTRPGVAKPGALIGQDDDEDIPF